MVFYAAFNSISVISRRQFALFMSFLGFTSTRLGSEVSCPGTLPRKNPEDPVRLEPRTPGLRVKHFNTEPQGTHININTPSTFYKTTSATYFSSSSFRLRSSSSSFLFRSYSNLSSSSIWAISSSSCRFRSSSSSRLRSASSAKHAWVVQFS